MDKPDSQTFGRSSRWLTHLRGHLLLFDPKPMPQQSASADLRLLLIACALEAIRLGLVKWLYPSVPLLILVLLPLGCALLLVCFVAGLHLSQIGFYPWHKWTTTEKSYFVQLLIIANIVFPLVFSPRLRALFAHHFALGAVVTIFIPYLFFGFYQEVVYRGILQSALVCRYGVFIGILAANILYTFGPLHWNYFFSPVSIALPMFASIFAIGLFFGVLFNRSGNLWIVAVIHGIGNAYIVLSLASGR